MSDYREFIESKILQTPVSGFDIKDEDIHPSLFPHQRDTVKWCAKGGKRAVFKSFGLGKTRDQLQLMKLCLDNYKDSGHAGLIVCPLGVRHEFKKEAAALAMEIQYVRNNEEILATDCPFLITNYERVRDGSIDVNQFIFASLDEASVLRSYGSKTYQEFLPLFASVPFRYVFTATPSPNKYKELIHYAGFLGVMDTGQALTRFFKRDPQKANNLTIHPHKEKEFWLWVSTWALFLTKPSDLGYSDEGYDLPPLKVHYHRIDLKVDELTVDQRDGQIKMYRDVAIDLKSSSKEKRASLFARAEKTCEIINNDDPDKHWIVWHHLEDERKVLEALIPKTTFKHWEEYKDGHPDALKIYERHYSAREYQDGRERKLFAGPGEKCVLLTKDRSALFVWRKFIDDSGQKGVNCAIFRNEGSFQSSDLILEAMLIAWLRWPGERLYTYVNSDKIESVNPGYCFKIAGWNKCGETKGGLVILEAPFIEKDLTIKRTKNFATIYGSQDDELKEKLLLEFGEGKYRIMGGKAEMIGSGGNYQKYCHAAIFMGINYKFNDFIQAIHRIQRFQQPHEVEIHILYTDSEENILKELHAKWQRHNELVDQMIAIIREHGLSHSNTEVLKRSIGCERREVKGLNYTFVNNDCVQEVQSLQSNRFGMILTSIPFSNHYEYTPSYLDFGHTNNDDHFFRQMDFLTPELHRVLMPGRVAAIHVKDRILFGNVTGYGMPSVNPFHAKTLFHFMRHGFIYMGMITIETDVVRENAQTYRLGWTEQCKDGSKMGVGSPEYLLLFRKLPSDTSKGFADVRVTKSKEDYSRGRWQADARAKWNSSGNRLLTIEELVKFDLDRVNRWFTDVMEDTIYDYQFHVRMAEAMDQVGNLPSGFETLKVAARTEEVWSDILRMRTLNSQQTQSQEQNHICPFQLDVIERALIRWSNAGDEVLDPFAGLASVGVEGMRAEISRKFYGVELNPDYFRCGAGYLRDAEYKLTIPKLFDDLKIESPEIINA